MPAWACFVAEGRELGRLEPIAYGFGLVLFGFVVTATARLKHEMMLLACIPAVFVAMVMGFVMAIYAGETFGAGLPAAALLAGLAAAWRLPKIYAARDQLIAIYLAWAVGLVFTLIAVRMPDAV